MNVDWMNPDWHIVVLLYTPWVPYWPQCKKSKPDHDGFVEFRCGAYYERQLCMN